MKKALLDVEKSATDQYFQLRRRKGGTKRLYAPAPPLGFGVEETVWG
jgi:hypothetical protein